MLVAMGVFALEPVRRRFFELFYYLHIAAFYMIVPTVLWHAAAAWEYFLPGLTVWFLDRLLRMYRSASTVEVVSAVASGAFVELRFRHASLSAAPGQYAFVNVPELSLLQWHPFSFSSASEGCYTFHIKSMGEGTWTGQLVELVRARGNNISLSVDGPCGRVSDLNDYKAVVLVAGGIGVTPCAAIYDYYRRLGLEEACCPTVTLLWTLRDAELLPMMSHLWDDDEVKGLFYLNSLNTKSVEECPAVTTSDPNATLHLFLTGGVSSDCVSAPRVSVSTQRLDVATEIPRAIVGKDPREVLVFVCGPAGLVKSTRDVALSLGVNFHEESFLL
ncbi:putative ferric reductase [Trypanosoma theileri]|uniref:Putative ferric reductase n=1 Tax=Trypanosoma theileri TaxID=67003 RepID=A0A1X0NNU2_9TRYP|nr:putative ferric reductase [Trypanosoma theileri]ORC86168.1 putative ferric reductase [Trypanosoma theileri]